MNIPNTLRPLARKLRRRLSDARAAIDLASTMVGVLVIGVVGGVIGATVFLIVPWAQDEAAKADLAAARSAQDVARIKVDTFLDQAGLAAYDLLPEKPSISIASGSDGRCFIAAVTSGTGRVFYSTQAGPDIVTLAEAEAQCDAEIALDPDAAAAIADPALRMAMRYSLQMLPTDELTNSDVASLTALTEEGTFEDYEVERAWWDAGYYDAYGIFEQIVDLSGIERASSLTELSLARSAVTDLEPLRGMNGLRVLDLGGISVAISTR